MVTENSKTRVNSIRTTAEETVVGWLWFVQQWRFSSRTLGLDLGVQLDGWLSDIWWSRWYLFPSLQLPQWWDTCWCAADQPFSFFLKIEAAVLCISQLFNKSAIFGFMHALQNKGKEVHFHSWKNSILCVFMVIRLWWNNLIWATRHLMIFCVQIICIK